MSRAGLWKSRSPALPSQRSPYFSVTLAGHWPPLSLGSSYVNEECGLSDLDVRLFHSDRNGTLSSVVAALRRLKRSVRLRLALDLEDHCWPWWIFHLLEASSEGTRSHKTQGPGSVNTHNHSYCADHPMTLRAWVLWAHDPRLTRTECCSALGTIYVLHTYHPASSSREPREGGTVIFPTCG